MTTQQEQLRYLINLMEAVEQDTDKPVLPAVEKFNELMAALEESDLDESKLKKALATGAVGIAALMSNFANAAGPQDPANLIDASSPVKLTASCYGVLSQAMSAPGLDMNARTTLMKAQKEYHQMWKATMSQSGQATVAGTQAWTKAAGAASKLGGQGQWGKVLQPAVACIQAIQ
jgi:hypothetical protein